MILAERGRGSALRLAGFLSVSLFAGTRCCRGDRFPSVPVAAKIAHVFGWEVEETIAGLMNDPARRDDTGKQARISASVPRQIISYQGGCIAALARFLSAIGDCLEAAHYNPASRGHTMNKHRPQVVLYQEANWAQIVQDQRETVAVEVHKHVPDGLRNSLRYRTLIPL